MPEIEPSDEKRDATSFHNEFPNAVVCMYFFKKSIYFFIEG